MMLACVASLLLLAAPAEAAHLPPSCTPVRGQLVSEPLNSLGDTTRTCFDALEGVWTGKALVVWAMWQEGSTRKQAFYVYAPERKAWRTYPVGDLPVLHRATLVAVNGRAVLWGGADVSAMKVTNLGVIFDPERGTSVRTAMQGAPSPRQGHSAVAVGDRMFVFGGYAEGQRRCDGAILDPVANTWTPVAAPPAALCEDMLEAPRLAGEAKHAAVFVLDSQAEVHPAFYDLDQRRWTLGGVLNPDRKLLFQGAPVFGPDGALYLVGAESAATASAIWVRVDPRDGRAEELGQACDVGQVARAGDRVRLIGSDSVCDWVPASGRCVLPMRSLGARTARMRQLLVPTDDGFFAWGFGQGARVRVIDEAPEPLPAGANVRGGAIDESSPWCGGAVPPPWAGGSASPSRKTTLFMRRGAQNIAPKLAATVQTDADGIFSAKLAPGTYCAVDVSKRELKVAPPKGANAELRRCLAEDLAQCLATFEVPATGEAAVVVRIPHPCFRPCFPVSPPP